MFALLGAAVLGFLPDFIFSKAARPTIVLFGHWLQCSATTKTFDKAYNETLAQEA
jgi:hypothetical protein